MRDLQEFCERTVDVIKPSLVLATGDLTDAKTADNMGSTQQLKEWEMYRNLIFESGVLNKTVWLDVRGNHGMLKKYCYITYNRVLIIYI